MDPAAASRIVDILDAGVKDIVDRYRDNLGGLPPVVDDLAVRAVVNELADLYVTAHEAARDPAAHARWVADRRAAVGLPPLPGSDPGATR